MASVPNLLLLTLVCSYHYCLVAHAGDAPSHKVLDIDSMKPKAGCSEPKAVPSSSGDTTTVPLHHRYGPCSPVAFKKAPTLEEMLQRDQVRAGYIERKFSSFVSRGGEQQSDATVPATLGTSLNTMEYVISVGIGTPAVNQTMLIDTGSDISWVQCKPCSTCHDQADALFDPGASSTYSPFSCSSAACAQLGQEGNGCNNSQCQYIVSYVQGTSTTGTYSSDTLNLGADVINNFQFGCSHFELGYNVNDSTDGLMGLGGGAQSLVSQTAGTFGNAFSYCLPSTSSSLGFLKLGAGTSSGFVKTPMVRSTQAPTFYGVHLEAIQVGGTQINVPSSVFSAGFVMDSGTVITRLPPTAYSALSSAFKDGMKLHPPAPSNGLLDTCFDFSGQSTITIPTVSLVLSGGAVIDLDPNGVIFENCLGFVANSDDSSPGIIGNVQQRTFEVLYDIGGASVGFRAGAC